MLAQREPVAVSSHGSITGYFVGPDEYEEFRRFRQRRRSFATAELSDDEAQAIGASRMDKRHAIDEIAARQNAADEKRKAEAERREHAAVVAESVVVH